MKLTHERLVKVAKQFLINKRYTLVVTEFTTGVSETPDAAGWKGSGESAVIECKVSRSDFFANANKCHERAGIAIGDKRWFLTPPGLVQKHEIPREYGLIEYTPSKHLKGYFCKIIIEAPRRERDETTQLLEKRMIISAAWRSLEALALVKPIAIGVDCE